MVVGMTTLDQTYTPLATVALGDIVSLPDGRDYTARGRVSLPQPVGSMAGFIIGGELDVLLSLPPSVRTPISVYVPTSELPEYARGQRSRCVYEGAIRYWAPHLPAVSGAMGELLYRVLEVRGQIDPIVLIYRGSELIVFVRSTDVYPFDIRVVAMDRGVDNEVDVTRYAAVVMPQPDPVVVPGVPERLGVSATLQDRGRRS